jgi:hypothetical protein
MSVRLVGLKLLISRSSCPNPHAPLMAGRSLRSTEQLLLLKSQLSSVLNCVISKLVGPKNVLLCVRLSIAPHGGSMNSMEMSRKFPRSGRFNLGESDPASTGRCLDVRQIQLDVKRSCEDRTPVILSSAAQHSLLSERELKANDSSSTSLT